MAQMTNNPDNLNARVVTSLKEMKGKLNSWHEDQIQPPKQPVSEPLPAILFVQTSSGSYTKIREEPL